MSQLGLRRRGRARLIAQYNQRKIGGAAEPGLTLLDERGRANDVGSACDGFVDVEGIEVDDDEPSSFPSVTDGNRSLCELEHQLLSGLGGRRS